MSNAVVVIATVRGREAECARTVEQWRQAGYEPLVHMQPDDRYPYPANHVLDMQDAIAMALSRSRDLPIVFSEDDVEVSKNAWNRIDDLKHAQCVVTLYLPGKSYYRAAVREMIACGRHIPVQVSPVANMRTWYGVQSVWFPRRLAEEFVLDAPRGARPLDAGDVVLREWLLRRGEQLKALIPNIVQHVGERSVTSARYKFHQSVTYVP